MQLEITDENSSAIESKIPQAQVLESKLNKLGIEYTKHFVPTTLVSMYAYVIHAEKGQMTIGILSAKLNDHKDGYILMDKWGKSNATDLGREVDSQYLIDNIETIYNSFVL